MRWIFFFLLSMRAAADAPLGLLRDVTFDRYAASASEGELRARLLSPLMVRRVGATSTAQAIDLSVERFAMYVPKEQPANGYGVLVFIPPWDEASVPPPWLDALERHGLIFVTAAHSGNDANVLDRREPLALLAAHNVMQRYRTDPARVYVGGFSGGSRIAERLALAYPDVFRGALLNAGSDPIGSADVPLPTANRLERFQTASRIVYLTGKDDVAHLDMDRRSRDALHEWCAFDVAQIVVPWSGHEPPTAVAFSRALAALDEREAPRPDALSACRDRYRDALNRDTAQVRALLDKGDRAAATAQLQKIDARFGGLAAPFFESMR